ncbi:MAG TPA: hypothetical protein VNO33_08255 [Kofleriaceae bacterium]|nr:hypothetical protein [Kofleriaceae bacterium]
MSSRPDRRAVWLALADQFLDTETRHSIPPAALACVEAGHSAEEARDIWRYEVTPVLWLNLRVTAGEWACWNEEWLADQIARRRGRWPNRAGRLAALVYRARAGAQEVTWTAIERCIRLLAATPPASRGRTAADLGLLARLYFDFCPEDLGEIAPERRRELSQLYQAVFLPIFAPLVVPGHGAPESPESARSCAARVEAALLT